MKPELQAPSFGWRVTQSIALLVGFYVVTLAVAAVLFVAPFAVFMPSVEIHGVQIILLFACGWIPAGLLVKGVLATRRPAFNAPGKELARQDSPALFDLVEELASLAKTAPPATLYFSPFPEVAVAEVGGTFGVGGKRVLIIGVPLLECLTVQELRAVLAHELGHYAGGDTRLGGVLAWTEASFLSVLTAVQTKSEQRHGFWIGAGLAVGERIGSTLVRGYAWLYMRLTRASSRRQELVADALSARLAGSAAAIRALETASFVSPLYYSYLAGHVATALDSDAVPSDLAAGFHLFRARVRERGCEEKLIASVRAEKTNAFDRHPALTDRIAALMEGPEGPSIVDDRLAVELLAGREELADWLSRKTADKLTDGGSQIGVVKVLPWAKIAKRTYKKAIEKRADRIAKALRPLALNAVSPTELFGAVARRVERGGVAEVARTIEPNLAMVYREQQIEAIKLVGAQTLCVLLQRALLACGAEVEPSLGEPCLLLRWRDERIAAAEVAEAAMESAQGGAALMAWVERLEIDALDDQRRADRVIPSSVVQ